ncbi:trypsin-like peptidase domain-containing protein [Tepidamorphus sp. 3E244]|uniref:trypsin-like peptidase domain-containing protein n=1 Tax=Tepidamorphus sp. 3E244 TaxID=3385498 RepID=UPI0038FD3EED
MITLRFAGTDAAVSAQETFHDADEILIGRDQSWAGFVTPASERLVARRHARLYRDKAGHWRIEPQGNYFVAVNGVPLEQDKGLNSGDRLTLGRSTGPTIELQFAAVALPGGDAERTVTQEIVTGWRDHLPALGKRMKILTGAVAVLAVIVVGAVVYFDQVVERGFDSATLQKLQNAAHLVVMRDANGGESAVGTAWPVAPDKLVTNAHVAELFNEIDQGSEFLLVRSPGEQARTFEVTKVRMHAGYRDFSGYVDRQSLGAEGFRSGYSEASRPSAFDVALLVVQADEPLSPVLELAEGEQLADLGSGARLAFAGYPMRCVDGGNTQQIAPTPSVQQGEISSVTDYFLFPPGSPSEGLLVRHSVPATGGASGGPLIGLDGKVVAVLSGGTVIDTGSPEGEKNPCRMSPSAVMINYAQRADLVAELLREEDETALQRRHAYWQRQVSKFADHYAYLKREVMEKAERKSRKPFEVVMEERLEQPVEAAGNKIRFNVEAGREYAVLVYNRDKANLFVSLTIDGEQIAQDANGWMPALSITAPESGEAELTIYASGGKEMNLDLMVAGASK